MKRNTILILILILLAALAGYYYYDTQLRTYSNELSDFAVEDTASITKIFLADKEGNKISLTKNAPGDWTMNGKFKARNDAVDILLYTIFAVDVRSPVGRSAYKNVIKLMSAQAVKCEIYSKDNLLKTYYVGGNTSDQLGTYMYIEGSSVPFVTHIPGFNGFLTSRYFTNEYEWRERFVFAYKPSDIASIEVTDKAEVNANYLVEFNNTSQKFDLILKPSNVALKELKEDRMKQYLSYYSGIGYEAVAIGMKKPMFDSLVTSGWFRKIIVTNKSGQKNFAEFYRKPFSERSKTMWDGVGPEPVFDIDRMFVRMNNDTLMVSTQYQIFDKLFLNYEAFTK